jgi:hypothetical protein
VAIWDTRYSVTLTDPEKTMVVIRLSLTLGALSEVTIAMGIVRVAVRPSQIGFRIITFERKVRLKLGVVCMRSRYDKGRNWPKK